MTADGDISPQAMMAAMDENLSEYYNALLSRLPGATVRNEPDMTWFYTGLDTVQFNGVVHPRLSPESADKRIACVMSAFTQYRTAMAWWFSPATAEPSDLSQRLLAQGLTLEGEEPGMAADLLHLNEDIPGPEGLEIARVKNLDDLLTWCEIAARGMGAPA